MYFIIIVVSGKMLKFADFGEIVFFSSLVFKKFKLTEGRLGVLATTPLTHWSGDTQP